MQDMYVNIHLFMSTYKISILHVNINKLHVDIIILLVHKSILHVDMIISQVDIHVNTFSLAREMPLMGTIYNVTMSFIF